MSYSISADDFNSLASYRVELSDKMKRVPIFVLPGWLDAWWRVFGTEADLLLYVVRQDSAIIGIAPLKVDRGIASFIGDAAVCDYLDFIIGPGREADFFNILLDEIKGSGITRLSLEALRPDSTVLESLIAIARERHYQVSCWMYDVSVEMDLPETWDGYLAGLSAKQRHEVKRKLRRLEEVGKVNFRVISQGQDALTKLDIFVKMFRQSRQDKARFMTARMETFFELLVKAMASAGLLRLGFLELNSVPVASVICFDYNDDMHLYNSGYDPRYSQLSIGLLSKILCIKESIEQKRNKFDFLRGAEVYKYHLGGAEIPLYKCDIILR